MERMALTKDKKLGRADIKDVKWLSLILLRKTLKTSFLFTSGLAITLRKSLSKKLKNMPLIPP